MNKPKPMKPHTTIKNEDLNTLPVTQQDMLDIRADVSLIKDQLARLLTIAEAPGIAEAARQAKAAENTSQAAKAVARGELRHISG